MHISRVDLNLLVVLDAIYTEGGITRASQKLNLTQPAVSHALNRLRALFGDPLFTREARAMVPTPFARKLIEPVRRTLRSLEITLNELERFDPASTPRQFRIAVRDVLEAIVLPPLMHVIDESAPLIDVHALQVGRRDLESELAAGQLDLALDALLPLSGNIHKQRVAADRLVVIARQGHPEVADGLNLETYLRQEHILVSSRRAGPGLEDVELSRLGLQRNVRLRCQHYFAACRVVSETDLILTMPERYGHLANRQFGNRILSFPLPEPTLDVYLYWHANVDREPSNQWLRQTLLGIFGDGRGSPLLPDAPT